KDFTSRELECLAGEALRAIREASLSSGRPPKFLINSRSDIALTVGADGVHLQSTDVSPEIVRQVWARCGAGTPSRTPANAQVAVSCHSLREVREAQEHGADFVVFGPVFEKKQTAGIQPAGLAALCEAAGAAIPVLALGGVTLQNAPACIEA